MSIGNESFVNGEFTEAEKFHRAAKEVVEMSTTEGSEVRAAVCLSLGNDWSRMGKISEAVGMHKLALGIYQRKNDEVQVANCLNSLATDYFFLQKWANAEKYQKEAIRLFKKRKDPRIAEAFNNLGNIYYQIGAFAKAKKMLKKSVQLLVHTQHESLSLGNALTNLGNAYFSLKNYRQASHYHLLGYKIRVKRLISPHIDLANSLNSLGNDYFAMGRKKLAVDCMEQAVQQYSLTVPPEHRDRMQAQTNLHVMLVA